MKHYHINEYILAIDWYRDELLVGVVEALLFSVGLTTGSFRVVGGIFPDWLAPEGFCSKIKKKK